MVEAKQFGPVTQFLMGRTYDGCTVYTMACYLIGTLLIDSGPHHTGEEFLQALQGYEVENLVITHFHEDHIGNNRLLQEQLHIQNSWAHPACIKEILNPHPWADKMNQYRQIAWGEPQPSVVTPVPDVIHTAGYSLNVLHAPGHSPDHIVLFEPDEGWLFLGDLFISEKLNTLRSDEDANDMIASLEMLCNLDFGTLFCASGAVRLDGKAALKTKLNYWLEVRDKCLELFRQGKTAEEIVNIIFGAESRLAALSEGDMSRNNFIASLLKAAD